MKNPQRLGWMGRAAGARRQVLGACLVAGMLTGCADASLRAARSALAAGDYTTAHQKLVVASGDPKLSERQRGEVTADLCLTEAKLGAPSFPPAEQLSICRAAAAVDPDASTAVLDQVAATQRADETSTINDAIAHADLAGAEAGIARYETLPGADPHAIAQWSKQLWVIVGRDDARAAKARRRSLQPAISRAAREYPEVHAMNERSFTHWVEKNMRVDGTSLVSSVRVADHTLTLRIPARQRAAAASNLDRFAKVNDAMIARCGCDGRTNVAVQESALPAYLVRLDPATRRSEILVLAEP